MSSSGLSSVLRHPGPERWRSSRCQASVSSTHAADTRINPFGQKPQLPFCKPQAKHYFLLIALDALAQVKRGLRGLFSRRKKKKQPSKPEPTPSSDTPPTHTETAAPVSPVEAPTTSKRSVMEAEDAPEPEEPLEPPQHPATDPKTTTSTSLMPNSPPVIHPGSTSAVLPTPQPSERQPHISAPSQIEDAKAIDLNPAHDIKTEESGIKTETRGNIKPKTETGMSATSGPMGDHMAEVWRDSDVGAKEGRPVDLEGKAGGIEEAPQGDLEGGKF